MRCLPNPKQRIKRMSRKVQDLRSRARELEQQHKTLAIQHHVMVCCCKLLHWMRSSAAVHKGWIAYQYGLLPDEQSLLEQLSSHPLHEELSNPEQQQALLELLQWLGESQPEDEQQQRQQQQQEPSGDYTPQQQRHQQHQQRSRSSSVTSSCNRSFTSPAAAGPGAAAVSAAAAAANSIQTNTQQAAAAAVQAGSLSTAAGCVLNTPLEAWEYQLLAAALEQPGFDAATLAAAATAPAATAATAAAATAPDCILAAAPVAAAAAAVPPVQIPPAAAASAGSSSAGKGAQLDPSLLYIAAPGDFLGPFRDAFMQPPHPGAEKFTLGEWVETYNSLKDVFARMLKQWERLQNGEQIEGPHPVAVMKDRLIQHVRTVATVMLLNPDDLLNRVRVLNHQTMEVEDCADKMWKLMWDAVDQLDFTQQQQKLIAIGCDVFKRLIIAAMEERQALAARQQQLLELDNGRSVDIMEQEACAEKLHVVVKKERFLSQCWGTFVCSICSVLQIAKLTQLFWPYSPQIAVLGMVLTQKMQEKREQQQREKERRRRRMHGLDIPLAATNHAA